MSKSPAPSLAQPQTVRQIGIIGTGRVAQTLGLGLNRYADTLPLMWGRNADKLTAACQRVPCTPVADLEELARHCDVIAIAVSDDAVEAIVGDLANAMNSHGQPLIFHTSGSKGVAVLAPVAGAGARTAAIHPMMTFTGHPTREVLQMAGATFAITCEDDQVRDTAYDVVTALGGRVVDIAEEQRALYHAALCHAANHLVTLVSGAAQALVAAGLADPGAAMAPLVRAALDNALDRGMDALSGPLLRGDAQTIAGHLRAIKDGCPHVLDAYRAMACATLDALDARTDPLPRANIRAVLDAVDPATVSPESAHHPRR
ncbi:Rossmann-like and DUF2520 domain-containing protein [Novosphingobium sp. Leaf2]|uniref:Rossmann-like and DUF2520 domain-containing protein n=1 Tax=Novosphingobium sp. Leaf2 TaxID=1735670 RepID=UPI0006F82B46|nr:DUF2520 domain-containing protein [Novosphingobium sp. Leaf2]KQM21080.1 hypothetical protein ASE49_15465 [Novosphingobium sp. Leaf2]